MRFLASSVLVLGLGASVAGCGDSRPVGPSVKIGVAPLTLSTIDDACYRLTVLNDDGETVWQQEEVCSGQYGDAKGAITYVGPCDAQLVDGDPQVNTVRLELAELYDQSGPIDRNNYRNPCGDADNGNDDGFGACELSFECLENQDVFVEFNLTVMRNANQGFFDIAVNFEDVFCSAKLDSCDESGNPIQLLHGPTGRQHTAVAAIACTAGPGAKAQIVLPKPIVACDLESDGGEVIFSLDLENATGGNAHVTVPTYNDRGVVTGGYTLDYAAYFGDEQLDCGNDEDGAVTCGKVFYNLAINSEGLAGQGPPGATIAGCRLYYGASASEADGATFDGEGHLADPKAVYPWISFNGFDGVDLVEGGQSLCFAEGLNVPGSAVQTSYMKGGAYSAGDEDSPELGFAYSTSGDRAELISVGERTAPNLGSFNYSGAERKWACKATGGSSCNCCESRGAFTITSNCFDGTIGYTWLGSRYCQQD